MANLFELFAQIKLDSKDFEKGLDSSSSKLKAFGKGLKNGLVTAAKVGAAALGVAAAGVAKLVQSSIKEYAEYEQQVGGVKKIFSETTDGAEEFKKSIEGNVDAIKEFQRANKLDPDGIIGPKTMAAIKEKYGEITTTTSKAAEIVQRNAADAFKNAGMSANQYMETVTGFSASLIQSLGGDTVAAANLADVAIRDMSD